MKKFFSHYRFRLLLNSVLLVLLILSIPEPPMLLELGSLLLMVLAGINTVRSHSKWFELICGMGILSLCMSFVPDSWPVHPFLKRGIPQIAFILLLVVSLFHRVTQQRPVTRELLYGLCALYLNFVLSFALTYNLIEHLHPHSFQTGNDPLDMASFVYFSMITLTTIG